MCITFYSNSLGYIAQNDCSFICLCKERVSRTCSTCRDKCSAIAASVLTDEVFDLKTALKVNLKLTLNLAFRLMKYSLALFYLHWSTSFICWGQLYFKVWTLLGLLFARLERELTFQANNLPDSGAQYLKDPKSKLRSEYHYQAVKQMIKANCLLLLYLKEGTQRMMVFENLQCLILKRMFLNLWRIQFFLKELLNCHLHVMMRELLEVTWLLSSVFYIFFY